MSSQVESILVDCFFIQFVALREGEREGGGVREGGREGGGRGVREGRREGEREGERENVLFPLVGCCRGHRDRALVPLMTLPPSHSPPPHSLTPHTLTPHSKTSGDQSPLEPSSLLTHSLSGAGVQKLTFKIFFTCLYFFQH